MGSFESNVAKRRNDLDQGRQASGDSGWVMADILSESRSWEATRSLTIQDGPACASESMADLHDVPKEENGCCATVPVVAPLWCQWCAVSEQSWLLKLQRKPTFSEMNLYLKFLLIFAHEEEAGIRRFSRRDRTQRYCL